MSQSATGSDIKKRDKILEHLKKHDLLGKKGSILADVDIMMPPLFGENIDEHFRHLAEDQVIYYLILKLTYLLFSLFFNSFNQLRAFAF